MMDSLQRPLKFLFLYTRLPDYFLQCVRHLVNNSPAGSKAVIVHYDFDVNAPFQHIISGESIELIPKSRTGIASIANKLNPDLIYIAGWGDKLYKSIVKPYKQKVPVVMGLDNPWKGNLKQKFAAILAPLLIKKYCTHLWVAGLPQYEFARKLGFSRSEIIKGLYCANISVNEILNEKKAKRILLYTGRMVAYKRPDWLIKAFVELTRSNKALDNWDLIMIGEGPLKQQLQNICLNNNRVVFKGFMQPGELKQLYSVASAYCLPSDGEHWGVVVQEAAAAGLPMLLSNTCGAASEFLISGFNGYEFKSKSYRDFKNKLSMLLNSDDDVLRQMGLASKQFSTRITKDNWAAALKSVLIESV